MFEQPRSEHKTRRSAGRVAAFQLVASRRMTLEELAVLVRNLPQAETLELVRLEYVVRALYLGPKRALAIRVQLHLGMTVRFFDRHSGAFHSGRIVAMNDRGVSIDEPTLNLRHSNLPYAAIDLRTPPPQSDVEVVASPSPHLDSQCHNARRTPSPDFLSHRSRHLPQNQIARRQCLQIALRDQLLERVFALARHCDGAIRAGMKRH